MGHSTGIAVLLLSLTAGTFLLAKTNKENLGVFYRVLAWFVIVLSILLIFFSIICVIIFGIEHKMKRHGNYGSRGEMMFRHHPMREDMGMSDGSFRRYPGMMEEGFGHENSFMKMMHYPKRGGDGNEKQDTTHLSKP
jgi:hypothetical protein